MPAHLTGILRLPRMPFSARMPRWQRKTRPRHLKTRCHPLCKLSRRFQQIVMSAWLLRDLTRRLPNIGSLVHLQTAHLRRVRALIVQIRRLRARIPHLAHPVVLRRVERVPPNRVLGVVRPLSDVVLRKESIDVQSLGRDLVILTRSSDLVNTKELQMQPNTLGS